MPPPATAKIRIGAWCVDPTAGQMSRGGKVIRVEARTLRLLVDLAEHAGEVVSIDDLLDRVWAGVIITPDSVYQAVASLRRLLGDDPRRPSYVATVPRLGYRMVASVAPWTDTAPAETRGARARWVAAGLAATLALLGVVLVLGQVARGRHAAAAAQSVASVGVLEILDLTDTMDQEIRVAEMTEGLIDKIGKNPRLRTPGPRSSYRLKGKHLSTVDAAKALGVAYLLDWSIHSAGPKLRIESRLMRGDTGFIIWTQTYVRPPGEMPQVEDDIASRLARSLAPDPGRR
jgi:DNA-binding winged helix-turn-helix (wHTH) protein/TolB-like protein